MNYREAIGYLEKSINYENIPAYPYKESFKLNRIKGFLKIIGNPQDRLKCVHVAGSKGKGSTGIFIAYILRESGYNVGLYTSPHLVDFRERIRILNAQSTAQNAQLNFEGMISRRDLAGLVKRLKPQIERYNRNSEYGPLTFFEIYTAIAFVYFKEQGIDLVVLETGLGGRLDATNTVNSLVCVITPISYEHTQKLGHTLSKIAREKSGIIKRHALVITAPQEKEALKVLRNRCQNMKAKLYQAGKDIKYKKTGTNFGIHGLNRQYKRLKINLLGEHQFINASVAVGAVELLDRCGVRVKPGSIKRGLSSAVWPGRCEVISRSPWVILDGAQNKASASVLAQAVKNNFKYKKLILVFGVSCDKDIAGIANVFSGLADNVILTRSKNPRATDPKLLARYFTGKPTYLTRSVLEAKRKAVNLAQAGDLVLVSGSLFVVGEYR